MYKKRKIPYTSTFTIPGLDAFPTSLFARADYGEHSANLIGVMGRRPGGQAGEGEGRGEAVEAFRGKHRCQQQRCGIE